ncbi:MAG: ADP-ribosylglycohydrolase family protein [Bacteroidota bacterium]
MKLPLSYFLISCLLLACSSNSSQQDTSLVISRTAYHDRLEGFWLGSCIANWTGLVTEMDKVGNIGEFKTGAFYTRDDWGKPDQPNIWSGDQPSDLSPSIDFVFRDQGESWGADDDTDIEYMYQELIYKELHPILSPEEIREGWLTHIRIEEENYLWVSNQRAFDLMRAGSLPPATSLPDSNEHYDMIDAQLTTEIFGLFAPGRKDMALKMAELPIRTTAYANAAHISRFYVSMYALASAVDSKLKKEAQIMWMADHARQVLPEGSYPDKMYQFVLRNFQSGMPWEACRDAIYQRYQVDGQDGYDITSRELYCNGCFAAGINFAASLVSLFYGKGNIKETIKIGTLCGWDSDNPTATWGGLLGFMYGKKGIEQAFGRTFSDQYHIHRTRQNFPNDGMDNFDNMATKGVKIVDEVVVKHLGGSIDQEKNAWIIP